MSDLYLVFDVESIGLHGTGFAVGWVVVDRENGETLEKSELHCDHSQVDRPIGVSTESANQVWVRENCRFDAPPTCASPLEVRYAFWAVWMRWKVLGAKLAADVPWPVEARFLAACIDDEPKVREWLGPYPIIDVASVRLGVSLDPLELGERLPDETPPHNPRADAQQSARLLLQAFAIADSI